MRDLISCRLEAAREKAGLTQAQLSEKLGFKDRQTLAVIEAGSRKVTAEELLRAIDVLGVDLDYFTDGFRLVGEGRFSWRAHKNAAPGLLHEFEEKAGRWIATYRKLGEREGAMPSPLQVRLALLEGSTFEEVRAAAEALGREWDLGEIPALRLEARLRERLAGPARVARQGRSPRDPGREAHRKRPPEADQLVPKLYGSEFVRRLYAALSEGDLSVRRAATLLETTIQDLADLFRAYELTIPFDL